MLRGICSRIAFWYGIVPEKADDAAGLTPGKEDNAFWRNSDRKDVIFYSDYVLIGFAQQSDPSEFVGMCCTKGSLVESELSAELTEGLWRQMLPFRRNLGRIRYPVPPQSLRLSGTSL